MAFVAAVSVKQGGIGATSQSRCHLQQSRPPSMSLSRRQALRKLALAAVAVATASANPPTRQFGAQAAMYSADTKPSFATGGDAKKLSTYMPQIEAGYSTLLELREKWTDKTKAYDGDIGRRDLGTVGVKSPLFNIRKTLLKAWQIIAETSDSDTLIEDLETEWNDVVSGISSVDFQLYTVSFTDLTESKDSLLVLARGALDDLIAVYSSMLDKFHSAL